MTSVIPVIPVIPDFLSSGDVNESNKFYLEVLKDGKIIDTIQLDRNVTTFGRQPDAVDVILDHQSVSRKHATLVYKNDSSLMIIDCNSSQGTHVNKKKIIPNEYQRIYVGDIITFAESTRKYIVNGPSSQMRDEYDSLNLQLYRKKVTEESIKIKSDSTSISWGIHDDDSTVADSNDDNDSNSRSHISRRDDESLPDYIRNDDNYDRKYGDKFEVNLSVIETSGTAGKNTNKLIDRLKTKERKVQNLQEEIKRIYLKEGSQDNGLTEGQLAVVTRNDSYILQLKSEIDQILGQINSSMGNGHTATSSVKRGTDDGNDIGGDDVIDTTRETANATVNWRMRLKQKDTHAPLSTATSSGSSRDNSDGYTYDDLMKSKNEYINQVNNVIARKDALTLSIADVKRRIDTNSADVDTILGHTEVAEMSVELQQVQKEETEVRGKIAYVERLLKVALPALPSLVSAENYSNTNTCIRPSTTATLSQGDALILADAIGSAQANCIEADQIPSKKRSIDDISDINSQTITATASANTTTSASASIDTNEVKAAHKRPNLPDSNVNASAKLSATFPARAIPAAAAVAPARKGVAEDEVCTWMPPPNQAGDGKTSLNDKYGY